MKNLLLLVEHICSGRSLSAELAAFLNTDEGRSITKQMSSSSESVDRYLSAIAAPKKEKPPETQSPPPSLPLTPGQEKAVKLIREWLSDSSAVKYFCVKGFAGSGKTFLLNHLKNVFAEYKNISSVLYVTPTHKAANVLSLAAGVEVSTLASFLGVKASSESEEVVYELPENLPDIPRGSLVVVDESSMVSNDYLQFIYRVQSTYKLRFIFFGDPAQLPPPGETRSPVWGFVPKDNQVVLTDVKRYYGDLLSLATHVRGFVFDKSLRNTDVFEDRGCESITLCTSLSKHIRADLDSFRDGTAKVISWRNVRVDSLAENIRHDLGFTEIYSVGERYNLRRPVKTIYGSEVGYPEDEVLITDRSYDADFQLEGFCLPCYVLTVTGPFSASFRVIDPDKEYRLDEALAKLSRKARGAKGYERKAHWRTFWSVKNSFASMKSSYSLTAHRSQGSQFKTVYVDAVDILANPRKSEAYRCLYVAITRSSNRLIIRT